MDQINFSKEELNEFKIEVLEMLESSEISFLKLEKGELLKNEYQSIFRAFHSIKGGAGMFNLQKLQHHMHEIENIFQHFKNEQILRPETTAFFISSIDAAKRLMENETIIFNYQIPHPDIDPKLKSSTLDQRPTAKRLDKGDDSKKSSSSATLLGKVFVIDDQPEIVEIVTTYLSENFKAIGFTDPKQALEQLAKEKPDVVITDMVMPHISGMDVLKKCIEYDPELPVIFLSGELTKKTLFDALSLGVYNAIEKPFEFPVLFGMAENAASLYHTKKLLTKAINLILYQFPDLSQMLLAKGQHEAQQVIAKTTKELLELKRKIKNHRLSLTHKNLKS